MFARTKAIAVTMTVLLVVGACGAPQPTQAPPAVAPTHTSVPPTSTLQPPTATPVPPTNTPVPPTATATLLSTATPIPPTATPTPAPPATPIAESWFDGVRVTFVHNTGFLITVGEVRILIDVLYEGYPGGVLKPVLDSQPPFDGVGLILATHEHHDHFSPDLVLRYMQANPHAVFISTQRAVEQLVALDNSIQDRTTPIELSRGESEQIDLDGVALEAIHLSHGMPGLLNLGFIMEIGDVRLFHTGDVDPDSVSVFDLQSYGLPERQIDVALVPDFLLTTEDYHPHVLVGIQARYLIPMHFSVLNPPVISETDFPNVFIFQEPYESWVLPSTANTTPMTALAP
jgi:L-ascorbate metabolism protein UlaG (beta-lactamase superfamily)